MIAKKLPRRDVLKGLSAASFAALVTRPTFAAPVPPHPDPAAFQSGDFVWPALPGAFIPRYSVRGIAPSNEAVDWEEEKRKFVEDARASGNADQQAVAEQLEGLTYDEFQARYFDGGGDSGTRTRGFVPRGISIPQVGHVALLEVDAEGVAWVIEAMPKAQKRYESLYSRFKNGVTRTQYTDWIAQHEAYNVWHGRLKNFDQAQRTHIIAEAKPFLGRDYWFWSFNLNDETAFYCSKLVWLSVWKAINFALDGDTSFARNFWVTPKQLVYATSIELLHNPGAYGGP